MIDQQLMSYLLRGFEVLGVLGATFFAAMSVRYVRDSLKETQKQNNPSVVVFVRQRLDSLNIVDLVVKNEGIRSARNLSFKVLGKLPVIGKRNINDIGIIKSGITILAGGQEIAQPLAVMIGEEYKKLKRSDCSIKVTYNNERNIAFHDTFKLDFKGLVDRQLGKPYEAEIVEALQGIHTELNKIKADVNSLANKGITPLHAEPYYEDTKFKESEKLGQK